MRTVLAKNIKTANKGVFGAYGQHVLSTDDETTARKKIEEEDGSLTVTHTTPLIRIHKETSLATWFGNVTSAWGCSRRHGATEPPYRGDDDLYHPPPRYDPALSVAESSQVLVKWEQGDLVLLDNYAAMHSRSAWKGERQVLAAL
ncbi:hypothetical protein EDB81DRAFT_841123 [Dactylonectria macrodidyma]|uniref:TauD/TfdA-like domain-containing protein n=1 Tax=Dactylonectria macrodidyma TaxID=307937 RepID=A0A9P9F1C5_9HYPO|nr:hypothetical protein EDB81DRAFT_841123 [Dactylonectria macrodidyma]